MQENKTVVFLTLCMSRLYHSLEWYTRVYTIRDYGITYLFHDRRARDNTGLRTARSTGHASVEWV